MNETTLKMLINIPPILVRFQKLKSVIYFVVLENNVKLVLEETAEKEEEVGVRRICDESDRGHT